MKLRGGVAVPLERPVSRLLATKRGTLKGNDMHYRNGREAKNGDKIVFLGYAGGVITAVGTLRDATPGNDYCNGYIQVGHEPNSSDPMACMCDCLHVEDVAEIFAEKGLDKRPAGM